MYNVDWINNNGWNLDLHPRRKRVAVIANTLLYNFYTLNNYDIKIFLYTEPPEIISGINEYTLMYFKKYHCILTWKKDILYWCNNARKMLYIDPWVTDSFTEKQFKITFVKGYKAQTDGHLFRWHIYRFGDTIYNPTQIFDRIEDNKNTRQKLLFSDSQFNLAIENSQYDNYFTEKIIDCFLTKTIPIYWGCPNINEYFDVNGIVPITRDNCFQVINKLDENYYINHLDSVNKNYEIAKEMCKISGQNIIEGFIDKLENENLPIIKEKFSTISFNREPTNLPDIRI